MPSKRAAEEYDSDDGFVADVPRNKKSKPAPKSSTAVLDKERDDDGNTYWSITRTRRVQVSEFKGKSMVGIREYYEKDGKMLPGKKGISLTLEQFDSFIHLLPQIEKELKTKGHDLPRPRYASSSKSIGLDGANDDEEDEEEEREAEDAPTSDEDEPRVKSRPKVSASKGNHEATSDEDD